MTLHVGCGAVDVFGPGPDLRYAWPVLMAGAGPVPVPPLPAPGRRGAARLRADRRAPGVTVRAEWLTFAALAPDPGQPGRLAAWQAVIRAWLARLVAAGPGKGEISARLLICVKAASVRVPGIAGERSVAGRGEAAACGPA